MTRNPFSRSCAMSGCGEPVTVRGKCARHAASLDAQRGLDSDRVHVDLYNSTRWRRLRQQILTARPWCECPDCNGRVYYPPASVVHHVQPHGGDPVRFFDVDNLQPLAKDCHDRITGRRGDVKC